MVALEREYDLLFGRDVSTELEDDRELRRPNHRALRIEPQNSASLDDHVLQSENGRTDRIIGINAHLENPLARRLAPAPIELQ